MRTKTKVLMEIEEMVRLAGSNLGGVEQDVSDGYSNLLAYILPGKTEAHIVTSIRYHPLAGDEWVDVEVQMVIPTPAKYRLYVPPCLLVRWHDITSKMFAVSLHSLSKYIQGVSEFHDKCFTKLVEKAKQAHPWLSGFHFQPVFPMYSSRSELRMAAPCYHNILAASYLPTGGVKVELSVLCKGGEVSRVDIHALTNSVSRNGGRAVEMVRQAVLEQKLEAL